MNEVQLIELETLLTDIIFSFPPPVRKEILEKVSAKANEIAGNISGNVCQILENVFTRLKARLPEKDRGRLQALRNVIFSWLFPDENPWNNTLSSLSSQWPEWGMPWLFAAQYSMTKKDFKQALHYINIGNRRLPVFNGDLIRTLDQLQYATKSKYRGKSNNGICLAACALIAKHSPSIRGIGALASCAEKSRNNKKSLDNAIHRCFQIHGKKPEKWSLKDLPTKDLSYELKSIGYLCICVNKNASNKQDWHHNFNFWNHAAIHFFKKSVELNNPRLAHYELMDCTPVVRQIGLEQSARVYGF
jgi:hypothetical protein